MIGILWVFPGIPGKVDVGYPHLHCTPGGMAKFHRLRAIENALAIHRVSRQDIKKAWKNWDWSPSKVDLAEESWPILHRNHRTVSLEDTIAHLLGYLPEGKAPGIRRAKPLDGRTKNALPPRFPGLESFAFSYLGIGSSFPLVGGVVLAGLSWRRLFRQRF